MPARYRKIYQQENEQEGSAINDKKKKAERIEKITAKLHALIWVVVGVVALIFSDIIRIGLHDDRVNRSGDSTDTSMTLMMKFLYQTIGQL
jgi:hypothetical protein